MKAAGDAVPSSFKFTKHRQSPGTAGARLKTHHEGVSIFFFFSPQKRERARKGKSQILEWNPLGDAEADLKAVTPRRAVDAPFIPALSLPRQNISH